MVSVGNEEKLKLQNKEGFVDHNVDYYMSLPYPMKVVPREDGYFVRVEDLPGCTTWVDNLENLWPAVGQAKRAWLEEALQRNRRIPEPRRGEESLKEYSGKIMLRMPRSLHRELADKAHLEGVSLNHFIVITLARAVGRAEDS